jgi:PAS domain S-box-containing protein
VTRNALLPCDVVKRFVIVKAKGNTVNKSDRVLILVFIMVAAGIVLANYQFYQSYSANYRDEVERQISSIADLKVGQIVQWRRERLSDANLLFGNSAFAGLVQRYLDDPLDMDAQVQVKSWLMRFQTDDQYERVFLVDTKGAGRIFASGIAESIPRHIPLDATRALQSGQVTILDLDRDEDTPQPHMAVLIPILREQAGNLPLGVVVMRIDPNAYLYPLLQTWPVPSASAETLIVRRDGDYALFLNELRFRKDAALTLRISLAETKTPAVQAVLGFEGIAEGIDYRGVPAIADTQRIPDSPWFMVARVDTSEVYAPLTQMLWVVLALAGALLIGAGAAVGIVWRQQKVRLYLERFEASAEIRETQEKASKTVLNLNAELEKRVLERTAQFEVVNREIEAAREYAESVINTVREPLISLDQDLRVIAVSRSFYEFFNVTPDETVGQLIYDLGSRQWDIPRLRELLETILPEKATLENYEVEHTFSTIGRRIMLLNARQIHRVLGKERVILLAIEDITERKEIEAGLEKTRKELAVIKQSADEASEFAESVINTVREPLISLDQDLRVLAVGRSFYEFFKVTPEETIGQLIYDLGNRQWNIPRLRELLETILPEKATLENYEVEHTFSTIGRRVMLLNARQIQRVLGKERVILLAIEDITERKEIEDGLEKTRQELAVIKQSADEASEFSESVINTVREPLISLDQDLRVLTVSRSFYEFFRVTPEETVGQLIYDLGNRQWDIPRLRDLLEDILPLKTTLESFEVEHTFSTIGRRIMLLNARQIQRAFGKERVILLAIEDITEKRMLERGVEKARDAAEAANAELEAFSYSVSHDLRTPLRSIDGFSQALLEDYGDGLDDTAKSYLSRVRKATQQMGRLIDDLLKLSRVTRSEFRHESVDLSRMVRAIVGRLQEDSTNRTVEVLIQEGVFVEGDSNLLKIALENLVGNAWKFTGKAASPRVEFGTTVREGKTACFVRDNGAGFDMAYVDKLFGAFQRLHTAQEFPGTGIGLATVRRVINRHGGQVWVEAEVGKGATFYFTVPE